MTAYIIITLLAALTAVYLLFLFRVRQGLRYLHAHPISDPGDELLPALSIIVPMRNEERSIASCIESIAAQDYPRDRVECLLVDDHSVDATCAVAREAVGEDERFRIVNLPADHRGGKKAAITSGIASSSFPIIVTTDADCTHEAKWLRSLAAVHSSGSDVAAGPVALLHDGGLFGRLQALEFLGLVGVGAGLFGVGYPRLCNGANFSYRKELFLAANGYQGNDDVPGGDDEFLLHAMVYGMGRQADFASTPNAMAYTSAAHSLREFISQRVRWASKGSAYGDRRFVSFLVILFLYLLLVSLAPWLFVVSPAAGLTAVMLLLVKAAADMAVLVPSAALLQRPVRAVDILVAELLHAPYLVLVSLLGLFGSFTWKERKFISRRF